MSRKKLAIVAAVLLVIAVVVAVIILSTNGQKSNEPIKSVVKQGETILPSDTTSNQNQTSPSNSPAPPATTADLADTIQKSAPDLTDSNGQVKFGIVKTKQPLTGWYVVSVRVQGAGELETVILRQTNDPNNPLTVVAGPGTSFPPDIVSIPDAVRKALN